MKAKGRIFKFSNVLNDYGDKITRKDRHIADGVSAKHIEYLICLREVDEEHYLCTPIYFKTHRNCIEVTSTKGEILWISYAQFDAVNTLCLADAPIYIGNSYCIVSKVYDEHSIKIEADLEKRRKKWNEKKKQGKIAKRTAKNFYSKMISSNSKHRPGSLYGHVSSPSSIGMDDGYDDKYEKRLKWIIEHPYQGGRGS